jgi:hypothetical protein
MFELNSDKFKILENKWEKWIGKQLRYFIETLHKDYLLIYGIYREDHIWLIKNVQHSELIIQQFCNRWIPTLWYSEKDCLTFIQTPEEMLYILQYVQQKYYYAMDLDGCNVIKQFIYYFTKDLLIKNNTYITHSLQYFINVNMDRLKKRKKISMVYLRRIHGFDENIIQHISDFLI